MPMRGRAPGRAQRGISLVEALVALLVLSVGMLGIAGLFVESVRGSRSALLRTQAVNLVSDLAERIRANATAREAYALETYGGSPAESGCAPTAEDAGNNCTPAELAQDDLARWIAAVRANMPAMTNPQDAIDVRYVAPANPDDPERYTIRVSWREPGSETPLEYRNDVLIVPRGPA